MQHKTYHMVYSGIFAVLLAICSWISIPTVIPFTLQTFAVFLTVLLLGGKQGTIAMSEFPFFQISVQDLDIFLEIPAVMPSDFSLSDLADGFLKNCLDARIFPR